MTGCAAVPMVCEPLADGRYRMTFDAAILPEGEGDDEIERLTRRYAAALEPHIRAQPELWLWMHSRWQRTRKQRRPEAIEKLVEEADCRRRRPLAEVARRSPAGSPARASGRARDRRLSRERSPPAADAPGDRAGARAAAAFGGAAARLGHVTRYFTLGELLDHLARARAEGRLDAELRELDRIPLVVVDGADPRVLDRRGSSCCRFLRHRLERGSVVLAGARRRWRRGARAPRRAPRLDAFLDACEAVELSGARSRAVRRQTGTRRAAVAAAARRHRRRRRERGAVRA